MRREFDLQIEYLPYKFKARTSLFSLHETKNWTQQPAYNPSTVIESERGPVGSK